MQGEFVIENAHVARASPLFFVSVDFEGLMVSASLLESTLMGIFVSVASKGFTGTDCL